MLLEQVQLIKENDDPRLSLEEVTQELALDS